jgi:DNA-binding CsgD family transcriptional regulator
MNDTASPAGPLRPKERVIRRLAAAGLSHPEIAWRFRCSPGHVERILELSALPRSGHTTRTAGATPLERTVLKARAKGSSHAEIGARMRRSPGFVARVEHLAGIRTDVTSQA